MMLYYTNQHNHRHALAGRTVPTVLHRCMGKVGKSEEAQIDAVNWTKDDSVTQPTSASVSVAPPPPSLHTLEEARLLLPRSLISKMVAVAAAVIFRCSDAED